MKNTLGTAKNIDGRMLDWGTVHVSPLSLETATAEKFVDHDPGWPQALIDMKLTYWVVPTEIAAVGMTVTSFCTRLRLAITCREKLDPGPLTGEPATGLP